MVGLNEHTLDASVHLDSIRGLAALLVFLGHSRGMFLKSGLHDALLAKHASSSGSISLTAVPTADIATIGHLAVIVFFVLSGYFVGGSVLRAVRRGQFSWTKYLSQRLTRLWIVLVPALLLGWVLDAGGMRILHSQQNIYSGPVGSYILPGLASRTTPSVFLGNVFFVQGIVTPTFGTNIALWSIAFEFWFYIFFPLLITVFLASKRRSTRLFAGVALLALTAMCGWKISGYFIIWLFGVGVTLLPLQLPSGFRRSITSAAGLLLLLMMYLELRFPVNLFLSDLVLGIVFSAFLWTILHARATSVHVLYRTAAQKLSSMSYTLYAVHMPLLALISAALMPVWKAWPLSLQSVSTLLAICALVFAASWLMYYCFERNTERIRKRLVGYREAAH
jgi:peptidoglycan/LPS O-acetylase OafA/YrhL